MTEKNPLDWLKVSKTPPGSDIVLEVMKQEGIPLTRENYLAMAYPTPEDVPDPWTPELEMELPAELRELEMNMTTAQPEKPTTFSVDPDLDNLITRYGRSAYRFFSAMDYADLRTLGVKVIEGECPGSSYFEAELRIPIDEANARAEAAGIPVRFKLKAKKPRAQEENMGREPSEKQPAPEQKIFGGKGIVIPFMFNTDKEEPAGNE